MFIALGYAIIAGLLTVAVIAIPVPAWAHIVLACVLWAIAVAAIAGHVDKSHTR